MPLLGKLGEFWKRDTAPQKLHGTYSSKESGRAHGLGEVKAVDAIVPGFGRHGVFLKRKREIMQRHDGASAVL